MYYGGCILEVYCGYQNHTASGLDVMGDKGKGTWPVKRTYTRAQGSKEAITVCTCVP